MKNELIAKRHRGITFKNNLWGWLFIALPVFGTTVFVFYPAVMTIYASFTNWMARGPLSEAKIALGGFFGNYIKLWNDEHFWETIGNTFFYMIGIPVGMVISLFLALCMNRKIRFANGFRVIYYIPVVASVVSITLLFSRLFDYEGLVNRALAIFGVEPIKWTQGAPWLKKTTILIMLVWKGLGGTILLFIAALQGVNQSFYEAAKIDGAGNFKIFVKITMPQLYPVVFYILVTSFIGGAQIYTEPLLFYPNAGYDVKPLVQYLYEAYSQRLAGYSSAIGVTLGLIVFVLVALQFAVNKWREKNDF